MTPAERTRKSIVWQRVERLLFSPAGAQEQRRWCACFLRSLADYWNISQFAVPGGGFPDANFPLPLPGFCLSYDLARWNDRPKRASLRLAYEDVVFASYDIDHTYQSRRLLFDEPSGSVTGQYPNTSARTEHLKADVQWVLERYILHPCAHVHPVADIFSSLRDSRDPFRDVVHEIRLGFGLTNPFATLFQIRVQLGLQQTAEDTKKPKEAERDRVAQLVCQGISQRGDVQQIAPGVLFGLTR